MVAEVGSAGLTSVRTKIHKGSDMSMNRLVLAVTAFAAIAIAAPAFAADLNGPASLKDVQVYRRAAGHCYFRGDVGYSWSGDPHATFTQTDLGGVFITNGVSGDIDDSWLAGAGFGCGSGPRGIRGGVMFDLRGDRDLNGVVALPQGGTLNTSIQTSTIMFNAYYDFGHWGGFVPYVGVGVGLARNEMGGIGISTSANTRFGEDRWQVPASRSASGWFWTWAIASSIWAKQNPEGAIRAALRTTHPCRSMISPRTSSRSAYAFISAAEPPVLLAMEDPAPYRALR